MTKMVRNANNARTATENFEAIATLAKPERAKILLTCRTEYFSTEKEVDKMFRRRYEAIKTKEDWIEGRKGFKCAYLQLLDDKQLEQALERRAAVEAPIGRSGSVFVCSRVKPEASGQLRIEPGREQHPVTA